MKRIFMVSVAALVASTSAHANLPAAEALLEKQALQGLQASVEIASGSISAASQIAGRSLGGVVVAASEAPAVYGLGSVVASALTSSKRTLTQQELSDISDVLANDQTLVAGAEMQAVANTIKKGAITRDALTAEIANVAKQDVFNVLPSKTAKLSASERLNKFAADAEFEAAFANQPASLEAETARATALQSIMESAAVACPVSGDAACSNKFKTMYQGWVANNYDADGDLGFIVKVAAGFPEEGANVQPLRYVEGDINYQAALTAARAENADVVPASLQALDHCHRTGKAPEHAIAN